MEVHKHPHHATQQKKWREYLLEFFMLFLAVFLGFIAENIRERVVENHRGEQFMESLLRDLAADTSTINRAIPLKELRIKAIDTVFIFFNTYPDAKTISGKMFRTIRRTNYDFRFTRNAITINQLQNAGGMRLIRKRNVVDSISAYDHFCESTISLYNQLYMINGQLGARGFEKLFNATDLLPLYITNNTRGIVQNIPDSLVIRINIENLNEQLNLMMQEKAYARQEIENHAVLKARATRLMELIREEYNLE